MKDELTKLGKKLFTPGKVERLDDKTWQEISKKVTVVFMAGGESSRFREVIGSENVSKLAFRLPNGDTMMEMAVRMYEAAGIHNFVSLVQYNAQSIIDLIGDKSKYCFDPDQPSGKGGAIRNAFEKDFISNDQIFVVQNPDDIILNYEGNFARDILEAHLSFEKRGAVATAIVCHGNPYDYSGMKVVDGMVVEEEMYPFIPVPAHIGVSIFSANLKNLFINSFKYGEKVDFERTLFPKLSENNQLFAFSVPYQCWTPVNNLKHYKELLKKLAI